MRTSIVYGLVLVAALWVNSTFAQDAVSQWAPEVEAACAVHGCDPSYILGIIACESGGDPSAVSATINPGTGDYDYGLLQISTLWGGESMGPIEQIWFAAAHAGKDIWWACG